VYLKRQVYITLPLAPSHQGRGKQRRHAKPNKRIKICFTDTLVERRFEK
jgi:hypothetical protein